MLNPIIIKGVTGLLVAGYFAISGFVGINQIAITEKQDHEIGNYKNGNLDFDVENPFDPFVKQFGEELAEEHMFMFKNGDIYAYKNIMTRWYVYIDEEGNLYKYVGDGKYEINNDGGA